MRFVLEVENRAIAIIDSPNLERASALARSEYLGNVLEDTLSAGIALWDEKS
jgi:hypothetical protein